MVDCYVYDESAPRSDDTRYYRYKMTINPINGISYEQNGNSIKSIIADSDMGSLTKKDDTLYIQR